MSSGERGAPQDREQPFFAEPACAVLFDAARESGVRDQRVLAAVAATPRSFFVRPEHVELVARDAPIPIGHGQTTSQPSLIALMVESLRLEPGDRILEVGSGLGYETAILSQLCAEVHGIEYVADLAHQAQRNLESFGVDNARVVAGDGSLGDAEHAPYDGIIVCAAFPRVPPPLVGQLADGGRLVQPVGPGGLEEVIVYVKDGQYFVTDEILTPASFVKLMGVHGYGG